MDDRYGSIPPHYTSQSQSYAAPPPLFSQTPNGDATTAVSVYTTTLATMVTYSFSPLVPASYLSTDETKYLSGYSICLSVALLHLVYPPSAGEKTQLYVSPSSLTTEPSTCGWSDLPCETIKSAYTPLHPPSLSLCLLAVTLQKLRAPHLE